MDTDSEQFRKESSLEFSDEAIRRFLLGRLSVSEQSRFELQLLEEDGLEPRVRLAELDLTDDYAYLRLERDERVSVEEKFLVTAERRRKLEVSLALYDRFASATAMITKRTFVERVRTLFYLARPSWGVAFGLAILLVLFGAVWLVIKEPRIRQQITNTIVRRRSPPRSATREVNHPANTASPEHQITPAPMPVHDESSVSIALVPASSDSGNLPTLILPKDEQAIVRFQLALISNQPGTYRAELSTVAGQTVFTAGSIKTADNGGAQIDFEVPARVLKVGHYQIRVERDDAAVKESVGRYYFRVD